MDIIIELLDGVFEIILEGIFGLASSKKTPLPLRVLAIITVCAIAAGLNILILCAAVSIIAECTALGVFLIIFDVFFAAGFAFAVLKKWRSNS